MGRWGKVRLFMSLLILCSILLNSHEFISASIVSNENDDSYLKNGGTCENNMYGYILSNDKSSACITDYYGPMDITELIIPDMIDGYPVIAIGGQGSINIESYPFGTFNDKEPLSYISYSLFDWDNNLEEIKLPKQLEWIGAGAFFNTKLKKVILPDTVTYIGASAFARCYELEEVILSKNIEVIERYAFEAAKIKEIIFPDSLIRIEKEAFASCRQLEKVDFGKNISCVGDNVFARTPWLARRDKSEYDMLNDFVLLKYNGSSKTPEIPEGTTCIVNNAFEGKPITEVSIPSTVKYIGESAFDNCKNLKEIKLPESLERIGNGAFSRSGLTKITIPNSVMDMGTFLFIECENLKEINFGKKVKDIDYGSFIGTPWLEDRKNDEFIIINHILLLKYNGNSKYPVIPKGIESIAEKAFFQKQLDFIEIPASVTYIGGEAFNQTGLESIYFKGNAPDIIRTPFTIKLIDCENELYTKVYYQEGKTGFDHSKWGIYKPEVYTTNTVNSDKNKGDIGKVSPKKDIIYIVKKGDTLTKIAKKYNTTVTKIAKSNRIKNVNRIYIGQKLIVDQN